VFADELAVASSPDRVRSDELAAPVVHDAAFDEGGEDSFGVVGVRRLEQLADGSASRSGIETTFT
jgi:hypothetical protein